MSRIYDNWERLVAAVLKKEQLWQLFHAQSRSPSICSESSGSGFSFGLTSSLDRDDVPFSFSSPDFYCSASNQKEDDIDGDKTSPATPSSNLVKDQSPVENLLPNEKATFTPSRKRVLRIQVPKPQFQHYGGAFSPKMASPVHFSRQQQQSHPLPLPPEAFSNSSTFSRSPESRKSPCTSWKRGKLLCRGAFGNVYLDFDRDIRGATILVDPTGGVKLSNFGIEKQIAGQSHPLLLLDSPCWMAPEVIINPNASNKAIDIWSLGCTIIEMATSKPPLSQYDGVVDIFKIMNHRELPSILDHLSDEGKDFLRRCLQWNPVHRATAPQLLEHPFVKSWSPLAKQIGSSKFAGHPPVTIAAKSSEGIIVHAKSHDHQLDLGGLAASQYPSGPTKSNFQPRIISTPISPVRSHLPCPRSPQHLNKQISPPPKSNPRLTPLIAIGGNGAVRYPHLNQSTLQQETFRNLPEHSPGMNSPSYWDPNILNDSYRKQFGRDANGQVNEQLALADRVFQQLLKGRPVQKK